MGQQMTAQTTWRGGLAFEGLSGSGHKLMLDGARAQGASPMEFMLLGMAGCSSIDVVHILERMREKISDCRCEVTAERAAEDPKVFVKIHAHFIVAGAGLDPAKVERAIKLSAEKYCSASVMLSKTAEITHDFELIEAG